MTADGAGSGPFELIVVGSGMAASFFLAEVLRHAAPGMRIAVLERGPMLDHEWQARNRRAGIFQAADLYRRTGDLAERWLLNVGFGGGSNCWWGGTHRFHPNDFALRSRYGIGRDWPLSYADLEPWYARAEAIMAVSGDPAITALWRSGPFPQPPHRLTRPDRLLQARWPDQMAANPTARARIATATRPACCASGVCGTCPQDAKFTVLNGLARVYADPRVELGTEAEVLAVEIEGGVARGVRMRRDGRETVLRADMVVLAANALFNPHLLLRSGMVHDRLGRGLHKQLTVTAEAMLDELDNFQGSSSFSGQGLMLYDGPHRRDAGACLIETINTPGFRNEPGRWRQRASIKLSIESLPEDQNRVSLGPDEPGRPLVHFTGHGEHARAGLARAQAELPAVLAPWPVESLRFGRPWRADGHIIGTTAMSLDPADGVVDADLRCHAVRNLLCLGSSVFPTGGAMNPTLTICALALRAAQRLMGGDF